MVEISHDTPELLEDRSIRELGNRRKRPQSLVDPSELIVDFVDLPLIFENGHRLMISIIVEGGLLTISHHIEGFRGLKYLITYSWVDESFFLVVGEGQIGMRVPCKGVTKKWAKELINQHIPRLQAKRKSIGTGGT